MATSAASSRCEGSTGCDPLRSRHGPQRFAGTLEAGRGGGAFVVLPGEVLEALGRERRPVSRHRHAAAVDIGDRVDVELDTRPRELIVPDDLTAALAEDVATTDAFEQLAFTRRREDVDWVTSARRDDTRARRIAQIVARLRA